MFGILEINKTIPKTPPTKKEFLKKYFLKKSQS